jgi:hypothetical protein
MTRLATAPAGTAINPAVATAIKNLSNKEIEMIDPTHVMKPQFVSALKDPQVEAIGKSNKFTRDQKQAIRDERARPLNDDFATGNWVGALDKMRAMSVENLVKMDVTKLAEPGILDLYRPALLNKMAARSELTEAKADTIRQAILLAAATPGASTAINDAKDWLNGDGLKIF